MQEQQTTLLRLYEATGGATWFSQYPAAVPATYRWLNTTADVAGYPAHCSWRGVYCCLPTRLLPADPWSQLPFVNVIDPSQPVPFPAYPAAPCAVPLGVAAVVLSTVNMTGSLPDLGGLRASLEVLRLCVQLALPTDGKVLRRGVRAQVLDLSGEAPPPQAALRSLPGRRMTPPWPQ